MQRQKKSQQMEFFTETKLRKQNVTKRDKVAKNFEKPTNYPKIQVILTVIQIILIIAGFFVPPMLLFFTEWSFPPLFWLFLTMFGVL